MQTKGTTFTFKEKKINEMILMDCLNMLGKEFESRVPKIIEY